MPIPPVSSLLRPPADFKISTLGDACKCRFNHRAVLGRGSATEAYIRRHCEKTECTLNGGSCDRAKSGDNMHDIVIVILLILFPIFS